MQRLRVLIVEDCKEEAALTLDELRRAGFELDGQCVETEADYLARLDLAPDVILSKYWAPTFGALRALALLRERDLDIPLIVVTGNAGEEAAVECMRQGAADYMLKDRLDRLGHAVTRALQAKRARDERKQEQERLQQEASRLYKAVAERAQQLATLNEIGQAVTSTLDLEQVMTTLLATVRETARAEACSVALVDEATGELVFRHAVGQASQTVIGLRLKPGEGVAGWVLQNRQSALISDAAADARHLRYANLNAHFTTRDIVGVPLIARDQVIGVLELINKQNGTFDAGAVQLLESVGAHAAIAIENARLFNAEKLRAEQLTAVSRVAQAASASLDVTAVCGAIYRHVSALFPCDSFIISLFNPEAATFHAVFVMQDHRRLPANELPPVPLEPPGQGAQSEVIHTGRGLILPDLQARLAGQKVYHIGDDGPCARSAIYVPLQAEGRTMGVLQTQSYQLDAYRQDDLALLEAVAGHAAAALVNARLFQAEREGRQRLETLYRIGQTLNSSLDAEAILDRLTDEAMRATRATHGSALIARSDQGHFERRSLRGYSPEQAERALGIPLPLDRGLSGRASHTRQVVYASDVRAAPDYFPLIPTTRSELVAPIIRGDQALGNLNLQSPEVDAFRDVDLSFLQALTDQVAIALDNARLYQQVQRHAVMLEETVAERTAELRESEEIARALLNASTDAAYLLDTDGRILALNEPGARRLEHLAPSLIGANFFALFPAPLAHARRERIAQVIQTGQPVRFEDQRGGLYLDNSACPVFDAQGQVTRVAFFSADITERQRAEEEIRRALEKERELGELKSRFITMASHEFRTPLNAILSSSELLEHYGSQLPPARRAELYGRVQRAVQTMTGLLEDVLVLGKAEAGKLEFAPQPLDLVQFCRGLVEEMQIGVCAKHPLVLECPWPALPGNMDERLLRHILTNLLSNACKYSPPGSTVYFDLALQREQVMLQVRDEGIGIPEQDQAHLFEAFHRASNVRTVPGTGLGMAIVKRSVILHGGTVVVDSQVGQGTTVTVTLPLGKQPAV